MSKEATRAPITDGDTVLVGDIENKTGDPVFDGTIRQALMLHLAQSPYLEMLTERKIASVRGYMGKRDAPLTGDVALETCRRTGSRAAITGTISTHGDEYLIGLHALQADTGEMLVAEQARASGKDGVLKALDAAAIGLRTKLGESPTSIQRFSAGFDQVATSSLDAMKAYAAGRQQWFNASEAAAKPHYLRAIELDPGFASAYSTLSYLCANMGQADDAKRYMEKAYELRSRASERERARIVAGYH